MDRNFYPVLKMFFLVIFSAVFSFGCGSSKDTDNEESTNGVSITSPSTIQWDEGDPLSFQIKAAGKGTLSYILRESPDSNKFFLNEASGVLTASFVADFENPLDDNIDGIYDLKFSIIDGNQEAVSFTLAVQIVNKLEPLAEVVFPIEGANIGGFNTSLSFRGRFSTDEQKLSTISPKYAVRINGAEATLQSDSAEWVVQVPFKIGDTFANVEVFYEDALQYSYEYALVNQPVPNLAQITVGSGSNIYFIGSTGQTISIYDDETSLSSIVFTVDNEVIEAGCSYVEGLSVSPDENILLFTCHDEYDDLSLGVFNLETKIFKNGFSSMVFSGSESNIKWTSNSRAILRGNSEFLWLDAGTLATRIFSVNSNRTSGQVIDFDYSEGRIYAQLNYQAEPNLQARTALDYATLDFDDLSLSSSENIVTLQEGNVWFEDIQYIHDFHIFLDQIYTFSSSDITVAPLNDPTDARLLAIVEGGSSYRPNFITIDDKVISIVNTNGYRKYSRFDRVTGSLKTVESDIFNNFPIYGALFVDSLSRKLIAFDNEEKSLTEIDLSDFSERKNVDLSHHFGNFDFQWINSDYDWASQTLYGTALDWGGSEPSDRTQVFSIDIPKDKFTSLLTGNDFHNYFAPEGKKYIPGRISYVQENNSVWYTVSVVTDIEPFEGVYSLSLDDRSISTIYEFQLEEPEYSESGFLSPYSEELDATVLSRWGTGYIKLLYSNGDVKSLVDPDDRLYWDDKDQSYISTSYTLFDSEKNMILGVGVRSFVNDNVFQSRNTSYFRFNLDDGSLDDYATNQSRLQLPLAVAPRFGYDSEKNVIYTPNYGGLLAVDIQSGDRVIVPIKNM